MVVAGDETEIDLRDQRMGLPVVESRQRLVEAGEGTPRPAAAQNLAQCEYGTVMCTSAVASAMQPWTTQLSTAVLTGVVNTAAGAANAAPGSVRRRPA
ncbi:hypothetical protein OHS58_38435 [Amycolatopsis sp. NBC_00348]|uniref:hypothetical protein n=1 Tax=Amycolatopsis sp. NBC_00348 TaxID=2975956 RepID=UPI002E25A511